MGVRGDTPATMGYNVSFPVLPFHTMAVFVHHTGSHQDHQQRLSGWTVGSPDQIIPDSLTWRSCRHFKFTVSKLGSAVLPAPTPAPNIPSVSLSHVICQLRSSAHLRFRLLPLCPHVPCEMVLSCSPSPLYPAPTQPLP